MADTPQAQSAPSESYCYLDQSKTPLDSLLFLTPLLLIYEFGVAMLRYAPLRKAMGLPPFDQIDSYLKARLDLFNLFQFLGVSSDMLPGLVVVVVLFCWHLFSKRQPWQWRPRLYAGMWAESILWTVPLFTFGLIVAPYLALAHGGPWMAQIVPLQASDAGQTSAIDSMVLSMGAGIYEELLFRLMGIALLHSLFVDLLKIKHVWGSVLTLVLTSVGFGLYHFDLIGLPPWSWQASHWRYLLFYSIAGAYFAGVYLLRGFGIVVAVHALYDMLIVVMRLQIQYEQGQ